MRPGRIARRREQPRISRPSDAIEAAIVRGLNDPRHWPGRLDSAGVRTLVALRELGWDVVRKAKS